MATVNFSHVVKRFQGTLAVHDFALEVRDGEFLVLVGPSGCGKTTLLRLLAGLEEPDKGDIFIDGRRVNGIPSKDRDIAMVFQNYALYPHMDVYNNMAFGLKLRKYPKKEIQNRVNEAAEILKITPLLDRKPRAISGGERQRAALGRAIVRHPRVFLFDEPLSNLDAKLRVQMRAEIKKLHSQLRTTMIYVTHDQVEAMTMADRMVIMRDGVVLQVGSPGEVYDSPANMFVAGFIGSPAMNFIPGTWDGSTFSADSFALKLGATQKLGAYAGKDVVLGIRPEDISVTESSQADAVLPLTVREPLGYETLVHVRAGERDLVAKLQSSRLSGTETELPLRFDPGSLHFFDPGTGEALRT
ncbi:MAG: ABC transporter ATP-binding protein [Fidelibacterota bacterium]